MATARWLSTELEGQFRTDVALVQERLNDLGLGKIPVDGDYGALTASKVRQYQVEQGLHADGRVGPQTWADLFP